MVAQWSTVKFDKAKMITIPNISFQRDAIEAVLPSGGHHQRHVQQPDKAGQGGPVHSDQWQPGRSRRDAWHDPTAIWQWHAIAKFPAEPTAENAPTATAAAPSPPPSTAPARVTGAVVRHGFRWWGFDRGFGHEWRTATAAVAAES